MGDERVLVSQEPIYTCRFCGTAGHTIFQCTNSGAKSLETREIKGFITFIETEEPEQTEDIDMREQEEMAEQDEVVEEELKSPTTSLASYPTNISTCPQTLPSTCEHKSTTNNMVTFLTWRVPDLSKTRNALELHHQSDKHIGLSLVRTYTCGTVPSTCKHKSITNYMDTFLTWCCTSLYLRHTRTRLNYPTTTLEDTNRYNS
jgi:hypothetical protein